MSSKTLIGLVPVTLAIPSYAYYIYTIFKGKTVPHMYSWLIWAILASIGYVAQVSAVTKYTKRFSRRESHSMLLEY